MTYKYTLEKEGKNYRLVATREVRKYVKPGMKGGLVSGDHNLSQFGDSWISYDSCAYDDARVSGSAYLFNKAWAADRARIHGNATVYGETLVMDDAEICDRALVGNSCIISGKSVIRGETVVNNGVQVLDNAIIYGKVRIYGDAKTLKGPTISDNVEIRDHVIIRGECNIYDYAKLGGYLNVAIHDAHICWHTNLRGYFIPHRKRSDGLVFCFLPQTSPKPLISCAEHVGTFEQHKNFWKGAALEEETLKILEYLERYTKINFPANGDEITNVS